MSASILVYFLFVIALLPLASTFRLFHATTIRPLRQTLQPLKLTISDIKNGLFLEIGSILHILSYRDDLS